MTKRNKKPGNDGTPVANDMNAVNKTSEKVQPGNFSGIRPEFGRTADAQWQYGLKRGTLYNLHLDGKIKGVLLRVRGAKSGVRLWDMQSIRDYIRGQMEADREAKN
ncbi:MAG: hypothetical protein ABSG04_10395 [Verrucomicrobiota bacterium]|jgi:hypothetical protein